MRFPNTEENFDVMHSEMPEGVYPIDRADAADPAARSWSSSEIRVWAELINEAYESLSRIYGNKAITTADLEGIEKWEYKVFGAPASATLSLEDRRARLLGQVRYLGGINYATIAQIVGQVLDPEGVTWEIVTLSGSRGSAVWKFGISHLGIDTWLAEGDPLRGTAKDHYLDCDLDGSAAGLSAARIAGIQNQAYSYQIRIFGVSSSDAIDRLDSLLTTFEPARSSHRILNNFNSEPAPQYFNAGADWAVPAAGLLDGGRFLIASRYDVLDGGIW